MYRAESFEIVSMNNIKLSFLQLSIRIKRKIDKYFIDFMSDGKSNEGYSFYLLDKIYSLDTRRILQKVECT